MHLEERILVTGGSGFLGSHLCDRLLDEGANVICVDNFFSGTRRNVEHLLGDKRFELIHMTSRSRCMSRSTRSTTLPAPPRRFTTSAIPYKQRRPVYMARSTCWASLSG
jgi:nucleoside-diphosphate-sugar epimerase